MKSKTLFLVYFTLFLMSKSTFSQNLLSTDNRWSITNNIWWQGLNTTTKILKLDEPNSNNGIEYQRIWESSDSLGENWLPTNMYLRNDTTNKYYLLQNGEEKILYDFNLEVSDTFKIFDYCNLIVTSVDSIILLDNSFRKRITLEVIEELNNLPIVWIDGIGNLQGLTGYSTCGASNSFTELICFKENEELLFPEFSESCFITTTGIQEVLNPNIIKVFPNIFDSNLNIIFERNFIDSNIEVVSISGRTVFKDKLLSMENELELSFLDKGIYILRVFNKNGILYNERIVKM